MGRGSGSGSTTYVKSEGSDYGSSFNPKGRHKTEEDIEEAKSQEDDESGSGSGSTTYGKSEGSGSGSDYGSDAPEGGPPELPDDFGAAFKIKEGDECDCFEAF